MRLRIYVILLLIITAAFISGCNCASARTELPPASGAPGGIIGHGGIAGPGGMMGSGGMMFPGTNEQAGTARITMDKAVEIVNDYLRSHKDPDLQATEILEFTNNFYVAFREKTSGVYAFEALIDPYSGSMYSEPGPNMMWNAKYGMMTGMMWGNLTPSVPMTVTPETAKKNAQIYLDSYLSGVVAGDAERFYGYYTLEVLKDNRIYGMLSVNGYTGQIWYHFWHGPFLGKRLLE